MAVLIGDRLSPGATSTSQILVSGIGRTSDIVSISFYAYNFLFFIGSGCTVLKWLARGGGRWLLGDRTSLLDISYSVIVDDN